MEGQTLVLPPEEGDQPETNLSFIYDFLVPTPFCLCTSSILYCSLELLSICRTRHCPIQKLLAN